MWAVTLFMFIITFLGLGFKSFGVNFKNFFVSMSPYVENLRFVRGKCNKILSHFHQSVKFHNVVNIWIETIEVIL